MRSVTHIATLMVAVFFLFDASAQTGVSINSTGTGPDANAILDVSSTDKGVLLPRVTTAQRTAMAPTAASDFGMLVYDTDFDSFWYWDGAAWQEIPNVANTGNTLDEAYDEGGPGAGRVINATNGNVEITGPGFLTVASNVGIGTTGPDRRMKISGTGWTALEVENTDNQDAAIELTSQSVSNYVFTDNTGFLGLESNTGQPIIFRTNGPNERMAVQADGRLRVNNLAEANSAVVISNATGVLNKVPLTGNSTDVLLGTGAFGPASAFADHDWYQALSTNTPTNINDWIYTNGRVGIGTGSGTNPSAPLHVVAAGAGNPDQNAILATNPNNSAGQDAIVTARVAGAAAGDPFFSLDISGEAGWSIGIDNDHANRLKIAPSWNNLSASTSMTIQTDGNVGIGTTTPQHRLSVGTASADGQAVSVRGYSNSPANWKGGGAFGYSSASVIMGELNGVAQLGGHNGTLGAWADLSINSGGGNVGIGTASPSQRLHVQVSSATALNFPLLIKNEGAGNGVGQGVGVGFNNYGGGNSVKAGIYNERNGDYGAPGKLHFMLNNNSNADPVSIADARMTILSGGNVGIGTTAPASVFQISTSQTGNVSKLHNPALANGSLVGHEFGKANSTNNMAEFRYNHISDGNAGNWVNLGLWGSANTLNVVGTGNVGIGTTGPTQKLEVAGNTRITGLGGGGDRLVYANNNGDLYASTGIPANDADYIWNQNAADQGASFRVNGTGVIGPNSGGVGSSRLKIANSATDFSDFRFSGSGMGQLEFVGWSSGWNINTMSSNKNLYINRDAPSTNNLLLGRSGLETFISGATGNVGVGGVTNPQILIDAKLNQIIGTSATSVSQHDVANRGTKVSFGSTSGEFAGMRILVGAGTNACGNTGDIRFDTWECNTSTSREVMRITGGGEVGIGTASPTHKLHITGNNSALRIEGTGSVGSQGKLSFGDDNYVYLEETSDDVLTIEASGGTRIGDQGTYTKDVFHGSFLVGNSNADQCSVCVWDGFGSGHLEIQVPFSNLGVPNGTNKTIILTVDAGNNTYGDEFAVSLQNFSNDRMDIFIRRIDSSGSTWGLTSMRVNYIIMNNN